MDEPEIEDILREINSGTWTIGYTGQTPERLKAHMRNMHVFDVKTLRAQGRQGQGDRLRARPATTSACRGRAGATPELKHPGTPNLYDTSKHVMDGGGNFRANFGVERDGRQPAGRGRLAFGGRRDHDRLSRVRPRPAEEARLVGRAHRRREGRGRRQELEDRPLGRHPARRAEARLPSRSATPRRARWSGTSPTPIPQHREPLYSPRPDLVAKYPTHDDKKAFWRLPALFKTVQEKNDRRQGHEKFPLILTSGRLVEYEGGGEETRSNPWLAELQQDKFVEINPKAAARPRHPQRRVRLGQHADRRASIKVKALVTERVAASTVFVPFHFSGWWEGKDMLPYYPEGAHPIVRGEAVNTATTYGYDIVTDDAGNQDDAVPGRAKPHKERRPWPE